MRRRTTREKVLSVQQRFIACSKASTDSRRLSTSQSFWQNEYNLGDMTIFDGASVHHSASPKPEKDRANWSLERLRSAKVSSPMSNSIGTLNPVSLMTMARAKRSSLGTRSLPISLPSTGQSPRDDDLWTSPFPFALATLSLLFYVCMYGSIYTRSNLPGHSLLVQSLLETTHRDLCKAYSAQKTLVKVRKRSGRTTGVDMCIRHLIVACMQ